MFIDKIAWTGQAPFVDDNVESEPCCCDQLPHTIVGAGVHRIPLCPSPQHLSPCCDQVSVYARPSLVSRCVRRVPLAAGVGHGQGHGIAPGLCQSLVLLQH